jgi:glycosyltransferase involved in cell wall biosynthesis
MRLLFVSNLFPNPLAPTRGMFNAQQVEALAKLCHVTVIAPTSAFLPDEFLGNVRVRHPHFFHIPVLSRPFNGWLFAHAIESVLRKQKFDIVFASWAYPDAYAVMLLARTHKFLFVTDVLGSDLNIGMKNPIQRRQTLQALRASATVFAKSLDLCAKLKSYGIRAHVDYNGIAHDQFHLMDRIDACKRVNMDPQRRRILFVGNLVPVKNPSALAQAFCTLTENCDVDLLFIGSGPESQNLYTHPRVQLLGTRPYAEIPFWMNASDLLCLPSVNEGLPNVVLEAMACGLPVVASRVGGIPEVLSEGINGLLISPNDNNQLAATLRQALDISWNKDCICKSVARFDWDLNAQQIIAILRPLLQSSASP